MKHRSTPSTDTKLHGFNDLDRVFDMSILGVQEEKIQEIPKYLLVNPFLVILCI